MRRAGVAICAPVEAATVRVYAPREADVRAVVMGEDNARVVLVDFERRVRSLAVQVLDFAGRPGVRRVREGAKRRGHAQSLILNVRSSQAVLASGDDRFAEELFGLALPPIRELL